MSKDLKIKKGTDIKLVGEADKVLADAPYSETIAIKPTDFPGLKPKMAVKAGDEVRAREAFKALEPEIMRGVTKKVTKLNTAARKLSRLSLAIKKLKK